MLKPVVVTILAVFTSCAAAQPSVSPLTFQAWKDQQVLEAQNQTLRVSARIAQLKNGKGAPGKSDASAPILNSKVKKASEGDPLAAAEKDLRRNQESMQAASSLTLEDYVSVYLPTLQDQPEALATLAQKLSKEELAEIFRMLVINRASAVDTKRNQSSLSGALGAASGAKAL